MDLETCVVSSRIERPAANIRRVRGYGIRTDVARSHMVRAYVDTRSRKYAALLDSSLSRRWHFHRRKALVNKLLGHENFAQAK